MANVAFPPLTVKSTGAYERGGVRGPGVGSMVVAASTTAANLIDADTARVRLDITNEDATNDIFVGTLTDGAGTPIDDAAQMQRIAPGETKVVTALPEGMDQAVRPEWFVKAAAGTPSVRVTSYIS